MLEKKECPEKGCDQDHWISSKSPPDITLKGVQVDQKGKRFFIAKGTARDFDRLSKVPRIDFDKSNTDLALQAQSPEAIKEWQRPLNRDRMVSISKFFQDDLNFIVNAVIVSLPKRYDHSEHISTISEDLTEVKIPCDWMVQECPECEWEIKEGSGDDLQRKWFDRCPNHDCDRHTRDPRPALILDGQHRIRGTQGPHSSSDVREEQIVGTILLESEFPLKKQAEIFTQITTTAEDLDTPHKIYLLYQFGLAAPRLKLSAPFAEPGSVAADFRQGTELGARNRRAYEIACRLCTKDGPWNDMISILDRSRGDYIDIDTIVPLLSVWMQNGRVFENYSPLNLPTLPDDPIDQLDQYLRAIEKTWPKAWSSKPRHKSGALQGRGIFYVNLLLFESICEELDKAGKQRTEKHFKEILEPLDHITWDQSWTALDSPDKNKQLLLGLLRHKVREGTPTDLNAVVKSPPSSFDWSGSTKKLSGDSFSKALPLALSWERPYNAWRKAEVEISQGNRVLLSKDVAETNIEIDDGDLAGDVDTSSGAPPVEIKLTYSNNNGGEAIVVELDP